MGLTAAMEGVIVAVHCAADETVEANQALIVLESMKMEHRIVVGVRSTVEAVMVKVGDKVFPDQLLVKLKTVQG